MQETVTLLLGDCAEKLKEIPSESVDLVVTSPPYDNLREYKGYSFDFETIATELARVIKVGGVIVWVVGDATINGSETGTSFNQAIFFKEKLGLNLHDTMIWEKPNPCPQFVNKRYRACFEYMFVFSVGYPSKFNQLTTGTKHIEERFVTKSNRDRTKSNDRRLSSYLERTEKIRHNIWKIAVGASCSQHPATFPIRLAKDHILTWSDESDVVLDPFMGSGTTGLAALDLNRKFIGIEIAPDYFELAKRRIETGDIPEDEPEVTDAIEYEDW